MKKGFSLPKLDISKAPRVKEDKMGLGLSHPVTSKVLHRMGTKSYRIGGAQMQGKPLSMTQPVIHLGPI